MAGVDPSRPHVPGHSLTERALTERTEPRLPLAELAALLGHEFARPELLREAVTHPSLDAAGRGAARHGYERLEFLGDRVLGLLVAEWLLDRHPEEPEGALGQRFAALVAAPQLAAIAGWLAVDRFLILSTGEASSGPVKPAILADACEALIGALYLDGGLEAARRFVRREWEAAITGQTAPPSSPKTALQEWAQGRGLPLPRYSQVGRTGPDHQPVFQIQVAVADLPPATGTGPSKQVAETAAAAALLDRLRGES